MEEIKLEHYELYILLLWGNGLCQEQIAKKIFRSPKFVENVFNSIKRKLDTKNSQHSLMEAWKRGIITHQNCAAPTDEHLKHCMMLPEEKPETGRNK